MNIQTLSFPLKPVESCYITDGCQSIRPYVCLSHRSTAATAGGRPIGLLLSAGICSRYRSIAARAVLQALSSRMRVASC